MATSDATHLQRAKDFIQKNAIRLAIIEVIEGPLDFSAKSQKMHQSFPGLDVRLSGIVMTNYAFSEAALSDISNLLPLGFGVMLLVSSLLLRSLTGTLVTVLVIVLAISAGMGVGGFLGYPITPAVMSAPTVIMTVTVASSVHILIAYYKGLASGWIPARVKQRVSLFTSVHISRPSGVRTAKVCSRIWRGSRACSSIHTVITWSKLPGEKGRAQVSPCIRVAWFNWVSRCRWFRAAHSWDPLSSSPVKCRWASVQPTALFPRPRHSQSPAADGRWIDRAHEISWGPRY